MRRIAFVLALALASCEMQARSDTPILTPGVQTPRFGLWALLQGDCAPPTSRTPQDWGPCAAPLWVTPKTATFMVLNPFQGEYVLANGKPLLAQFHMDERHRDKGRSGYIYFVVTPEGPSPFARARIAIAPCLASEEGEFDCDLETEDELREAAAAPVEGGWTVVWVAP